LEETPKTTFHTGTMTFQCHSKGSVDSTNKVALGMVKQGALEGTVVTAREQTMGKGRMDRRWESPEGGLWMTVVLRPKTDTVNIPMLNLLGGIAVAQGIKTSLSLEPKVRWPNDILVNGKKRQSYPLSNIYRIVVKGTDGNDTLQIDANIYVPGGITSDGQMSDGLEIYAPEDASWDTGGSLPRGICAYAIAGHGGHIYLFGGWDGISYVSRSYRYDPDLETWETLAPLPTARAFSGAGVVRERIYVVGGFDGQDELDVCEVYDPQADTWDTCPPMNAPRGGVGVAVIASADTLYVIGGGMESYLVENEYFSPLASDPTQGTWWTFPSPLLQEWRNLGVAANETTLYAVGGWDGEYIAVNQAYQAIYRLYMPSALGQGGSSSE